VIDLIAATFAYYLPAYFVNGGLLVVGACLPRGDIPVATKWLGPHRTFGGLFFAVCCGGSAGLLVSSSTLGVFLGIGVWLGTLGGSLLKRLLEIEHGDPAPVIDQLDFIAGATLLGCFVEPPRVGYLLTIACITPFIHRAANVVAYRAGLKDVPY
jgi:CDP-2,3-bis-(O-geranylgeranyl)-sn-glycerol synthase